MLNKIAELDLKKLVTIFLIGLVQIYLGRMLGNSPMMGLFLSMMILGGVIAIIKPEYFLLLFIAQIILVPPWVSNYMPALNKFGYFTSMLLALLIIQMITQKFRMKFHSGDIVLGLFALYIIGSSIYYFDALVFSYLIKYLLAPIAFYFVIRNLSLNKQALQKILDVLIISACIAVCLMVVEFLFFSKPLLSNPNYEYFWKEGNSFRAAGTIGAATTMGIVLAMILPISIGRILIDSKNIFYKIAPFIIGVGILLSFTRAAWIGALAGLLAYALFSKQFKRSLAVTFSTSLFIYIFYFQYIEQILPIADVVGRNTSSIRMVLWNLALDKVLNNNLSLMFGNGYWQSASIVFSSQFFTTHNDFLSMILDFGLVGLSLFVLWLLLNIKRNLSLDKYGAQSSSIIAGIIAFTTSSLTHNSLQFVENINFLLFLLVALLSYYSYAELNTANE